MDFKKFIPPATKRKELLDNIKDEDYAAELVNVENTGRRPMLIRGIATAAAMVVVAIGIMTAALVGRAVFRKEKPLPTVSPSAATEYTIVYESTEKPYTDYGARIFATDKNDTVDDSRPVTELDLAATLRYTSLVRDEDKAKEFKSLVRWYVNSVKPIDKISCEPLTLSQAQDITWLYAKKHLYTLKQSDIAKIFSDYDSSKTLTHGDFKKIAAELGALFETAEFKLHFDINDVSEISVIPAESYGTNDFENCISITEKGDVEKFLQFLDSIVITDAYHFDQTTVGSYDFMYIYDADGNKAHSFKINKSYVEQNNCIYQFKEAAFEKIIEMIRPYSPCTALIARNYFNLFIVNRLDAPSHEYDEWYSGDLNAQTDEKILSDMTDRFYKNYRLQNKKPPMPENFDAESVAQYVNKVKESLYIDIPNDCSYAIVNGSKITGDDLARLISHIESARLSEIRIEGDATGGDYATVGFYTDGGECVSFEYSQSRLGIADNVYFLPEGYLTKMCEYNCDFSSDVYITVNGEKRELDTEDSEKLSGMLKSRGRWKEHDTGLECDMILTVGSYEFGYSGEGRSLTYEYGHIELPFDTSEKMHQLLDRYIN